MTVKKRSFERKLYTILICDVKGTKRSINRKTESLCRQKWAETPPTYSEGHWRVFCRNLKVRFFDCPFVEMQSPFSKFTLRGSMSLFRRQSCSFVGRFFGIILEKNKEGLNLASKSLVFTEWAWALPRTNWVWGGSQNKTSPRVGLTRRIERGAFFITS